MTLVFYIHGQALSEFVPDVMVSDSIGYLNAEFSFTPDWDGLDKWLHLKDETGAVFDRRLSGDRVEHLDLYAGRWEAWLHGSRVESESPSLRITTETVAFTVAQSGALEGEVLPTVPISAAEQIAADAAWAIAEAQQLRQDVEMYKSEIAEHTNSVMAALSAAESAAVVAAGGQAAAEQSARAAQKAAETATQALTDMMDLLHRMNILSQDAASGES